VAATTKPRAGQPWWPLVEVVAPVADAAPAADAKGKGKGKK
jgi:hypothetical protein